MADCKQWAIDTLAYNVGDDWEPDELAEWVSRPLEERLEIMREMWDYDAIGTVPPFDAGIARAALEEHSARHRQG